MKAKSLLVTAVMAGSFVMAAQPAAYALDYRKAQVAELQGLDKITARISTFKVPVGQSVTFGSLTITVDACYRTPPEERPESAGFLKIMDHRSEDKTDVEVFDGWMFASTPGLSALEHPVYDVWIKECLEPGDEDVTPSDAPSPAQPQDNG
ncbi:DUF2155 domain-containing protein [Thalassospira mesophila]|uniref:Cellulase n=1 Tax=Thalassospira mesophila TaxID=1293891 RepID=A0A1Y2L127_9PROT|nr:DUF2155 domain-containing protein [Thalassospira mesophila]OSQ38805.1 cellulase [Thalassospira mesophila]